MKNKIIRTLILALVAIGALTVLPPKVFAGDIRTAKIARFLASQDSPLVFSAPTFVAEADKHDLDYRLLVAISGVESTFGKHYIEGTYNVWGWGVGKIPFTSFDDGIAQISLALKTKYVDKGANEVFEIARIYCPPTYESWGTKVSYFMKKIDETDISDLIVFSDITSESLPLTL